MATAIASKLMTCTAMPATIRVARLPDAIRSARSRCLASFSGLSFSKIATTASPPKITPSRMSRNAPMSPLSWIADATSAKNTTTTTASRSAAPATKVNALGSGVFDFPRISADTTAAIGAAAAAASP